VIATGLAAEPGEFQLLALRNEDHPVPDLTPTLFRGK